MKNIMYLLAILLVGVSMPARTQDLGPVGPKQGTGTSSQSSGKSPVNLPYKPASEEVSPKRSGKVGSETIVSEIEEPKKEVIIPTLKSLPPPSVGAPDFGL